MPLWFHPDHENSKPIGVGARVRPRLEKEATMRKKRGVFSRSRATSSVFMCLLLSAGVLAQGQTAAQAQERRSRPSPYVEENNQIRRDKFDVVLPQVMRENGVDMWIHVVREAIPDSFGAGELGSTSGVFVFTDRGGDRIERTTG